MTRCPDEDDVDVPMDGRPAASARLFERGDKRHHPAPEMAQIQLYTSAAARCAPLLSSSRGTVPPFGLLLQHVLLLSAERAREMRSGLCGRIGAPLRRPVGGRAGRCPKDR